jgi:hypothetical protein
MSDLFENYGIGLESPPDRGFAITPDDDNDLAITTRGIMVGGGGNVSLVTAGGDTVTLPSLAVGVQYVIRARRVLSTNTTATGIIGLA